MKSRRLFPLVLFAVGSLLSGCAATQHGVHDLTGQPLDPFTETNAAAVLIFVSNDCPVSNRYVPEIERLHAEFSSRGVSFWLVHADPGESPASIRRHARQFGITVPELRDPDHQLVALSHVEVTPSVALFTFGRQLAYRGRIDDRFADLGKQRPEPTHHDLEDALTAVLAHQPVPVPVTPSVGCIIAGPR